jgi:hypothetical protein
MTSVMSNLMQTDGKVEPSSLTESVEVRIVDCYTTEDRSELAGMEEDPSQTREFISCNGGPRKNTFLSSSGEKRSVMWGSFSRQLKSREILLWSRELAEC